MAEYIPDHILGDILVRLPFKTLIRFRCVSKSWRELISSSYMTRMHSTRSCLIQTYPHPDSKIIARIGDQIYAFDWVFKKGKGLFMANAKQLSSPATKLLPDQSFGIVGSCNGIYCLSIGSWVAYNLFLWNPFTGSYFELPSPPYEFTDRVHSTSQAFGYDHVNDDYKVVKWFVKHCNAENDTISPRRHELCVYSLKQNSWKAIRDGIPFELPEHCGPYFLDGDCIMVNGSAHWLNSFYSSLILAFDLGTHEFRKISFGPCPIDRGYYNNIICLNGCLSLLCYPYHVIRQVPRAAHIWVMEEYGVETSWKKMFSFDLLEDGEIKDPMPVAMLQKGKKLLMRVQSGKLVIYDSETKSVCRVAVKGEIDWYNVCVCGRDYCGREYCYYRTSYWVSVGSFVSPDSYS